MAGGWKPYSPHMLHTLNMEFFDSLILQLQTRIQIDLIASINLNNTAEIWSIGFNLN